MTKNSTNDSERHSLKNCCVCFGENQNDDSLSESQCDKFVGIRYIGKKFEIHFPIGYEHEKEKSEKEIRHDARNLILILSEFSKKEELLASQNFLAKKAHNIFPIHAYIFIIEDFLRRGYFSPKETIYEKNASGKISWSRTIKKVRPVVINENLVYFEFVARKTRHNDDELISQIHKFCVYECFQKLVFLFTNFMPENPRIKLNRSLFTSALNQKIAETFNESDLLLFKNMLAVINFLGENFDDTDFIFGTNNFHHVWERLVDFVYGESDKEKFYPKVYWKVYDEKSQGEKTFEFSDARKNSLRPDTIMILNRGKENQKIFVLDSKYYRYGATENPSHLPASESIVKQLAYAKFIDENVERIPNDISVHLKSEDIFNAFIMPAKLDKGEPSKIIGYASADFVFPQNKTDATKPYHKIYGILLDTQALIEHHTKHDHNAIQKLVQNIPII